MNTITDKLAVALRELNEGRFIIIDAIKQSNYASSTPAWHEAFDAAREALAAYDAQRAEHESYPTEYRVEWEIDAFDAANPREAAQEAWEAMRRPGSIANVFTVRGRDGSVTVVDLSEDA